MLLLSIIITIDGQTVTDTTDNSMLSEIQLITTAYVCIEIMSSFIFTNKTLIILDENVISS
jgi:hypothetical protein